MPRWWRRAALPRRLCIARLSLDCSGRSVDDAAVAGTGVHTAQPPSSTRSWSRAAQVALRTCADPPRHMSRAKPLCVLGTTGRAADVCSAKTGRGARVSSRGARVAAATRGACSDKQCLSLHPRAVRFTATPLCLLHIPETSSKNPRSMRV